MLSLIVYIYIYIKNGLYVTPLCGPKTWAAHECRYFALDTAASGFILFRRVSKKSCEVYLLT